MSTHIPHDRPVDDLTQKGEKPARAVGHFRVFEEIGLGHISQFGKQLDWDAIYAHYFMGGGSQSVD